MPLISTSSSRPNFVFRATFRLQGRNFVFRGKFRLCGRISSLRPNFVFAAEFRLQGRISSSRPNFAFAAEFRQGRISSSRPNVVFGAEFRLRNSISSSGPNFVFRKVFRSLETFATFLNAEDFRLRAEFNLQDEFRLRISASAHPKPNCIWADFVFKFRLRAQFELQLLVKSFGISGAGRGEGDETGTQFPGSMHVWFEVSSCSCISSLHRRMFEYAVL